MSVQSTRTLLPPETREPRVRLNTLVNLRWLAVLGQTVTVVVAELWLGVQLHLGLCLLVIAAAIVANLVVLTIFPPNHRLSGREAFSFVLFDLLQLAALLALTGGLHNPFALLFLAPVTISATVLQLRATLIIGAIALAVISLLGGFHVPLRTDAGEVLALPPLHLAGFLAAITIGTLFLSGFAYRLSHETEEMSQALLATQTALAREQKLQDLGGVVAAAAHELGTPLATIKLVSAELIEELGDRPELREDAELIRQQADRCRDILRSMGRAGKSDTHLLTAPIESVVRQAAEPHSDRGVTILYDFAGVADHDDPAPVIHRKPEIIHGLRNMIQNAVDFARERVWVDVRWSAEDVVIRVIDDGYGYPPEVLSRLGDPFLRRRDGRRGYDGMGLGLFISKTLLERTGGHMSFANGAPSGRAGTGNRGGAIAEVTWPRDAIAAPASGPLDPNRPLE
ncbi:sensor histidine kinase RegB [Jannaschia seohaensis]|uniref:histidine kinase n=1 Tax=Jannaschia seohaensis TaxID=475081 RepID=A0A2Y9A7D4_9RHOB|nr:ActS/PrrB/RegB family redox-sensitive histidine kinase [Jannaschia seohaensis]PWJ22231.1 two-component system sensor histidine kinase RegB [Jannaschia seohaensis]SSA38509.1 two-component system, sensor histidine kinase RegB [Jannaschia seohaensis]